MYFRKDGIKITGRTYVDDQGVKYPHPRWMEGATDAQIAALGVTKHPDPVKPSFNEAYQTIAMDDAGEYVISELPLEQAKENKRQAINQERAERLQSGITYNGNTFDSDDKTIQRITAIFTFALADPEFTSQFITADNQTVTLSNADCKALGHAAAVHEQTQVFTARQLKDAVLAAQSNDELRVIKWPV